MEIKKILFCTDFLEGCTNALPYAVDLTKKYDAKLYVLHVIHDVTASLESQRPQLSTLLHQIHEGLEIEAKEKVKNLCVEQLQDVKNLEHIVVHGTPSAEILNFAEHNNIDLIVMGTHGKKGLSGLLLGSVAEKVVRNATCPVLTVRN